MQPSSRLTTKTDRAKFLATLVNKPLPEARNICETRGLSISTWSKTEHTRADNARRITIPNRVNLVIDYDSSTPTIFNAFFG